MSLVLPAISGSCPVRAPDRAQEQHRLIKPRTHGYFFQQTHLQSSNCLRPKQEDHLRRHRSLRCKSSIEGLMQEVEVPGRKDDGKDFALAMAQIASDVKGQDLCLLHVAPLCTWTSWMLLVSVTSRPQQQAVLARITRDAKDVWNRTPRAASPGQGLWEVQDYGDVVIHVFEPAQRDYYDLEGFYGAAEEIDIPDQRRPSTSAPR